MKSFGELYIDNRRLIIIYITIALALSMLLFCTSVNMAYTGSDVIMREGTVGNFGVALQMSGQNLLGMSISPSYVVGLSSLLSILKEHNIWSDTLPNMTFGLFDYTWARFLALIWVLFSVGSSIIGAKIEEINTKYVGPIMLMALEVASVLNVGTGADVNAAVISGGISHAEAAPIMGMLPAGGMAVIGGALAAGLEFTKMLIMLAAYLFMRYLAYAVSLFSTLVTGMNSIISGGIKAARGVVLTIIIMLTDKHPGILAFMIIVMLVVSVVVFDWAFRIVRYFKAIYVRPFFRAIFAGNRPVPLIKKGLPERIAASEQFSNTVMVVPAFSLMKAIGSVRVKKWDKWWLVADDSGTWLYKKSLLKKEESKIELTTLGSGQNIGSYGNIPENAACVRQAGLLRRAYIELFVMFDNVGKPSAANKKMSMAISREYVQVLSNIAATTGIVDYRLVEQTKRDERRRERESARQDTIQRVKSTFVKKN